MLTENIHNLNQIELDMLSADIVDHNPSVNEREITPSTLSSTTDRVDNILPSQGKI